LPADRLQRDLSVEILSERGSLPLHRRRASSRELRDTRGRRVTSEPATAAIAGGLFRNSAEMREIPGRVRAPPTASFDCSSLRPRLRTSLFRSALCLIIASSNLLGSALTASMDFSSRATRTWPSLKTTRYSGTDGFQQPRDAPLHSFLIPRENRRHERLLAIQALGVKRDFDFRPARRMPISLNSRLLQIGRAGAPPPDCAVIAAMRSPHLQPLHCSGRRRNRASDWRPRDLARPNSFWRQPPAR